MSAITRVDFIADQLRGMSKGVQWVVQGVDRAVELARMLDRVGVLNLWELRLVPVRYVVHHEGYLEPHDAGDVYIPAKDETIDSYAFDYHGSIVGYLGTPTEPTNEQSFRLLDRGFQLAWSAEGHGQVYYMVRPNAAKTAIEIAPIWASSSDAAEARQIIIMFASFFVFTALPLAGVSVGSAIGNAVLPASLSAAYPALATAVGNVALSAALSGGNVKQAVKNAVVGSIAGGIGAQVGGLAQGLTNSDVIATLAESASRAAISGRDIKTAVGLDLLKLGANMNFDDAGTFDFYTGSTGNVFDTSFNTLPVDVPMNWFNDGGDAGGAFDWTTDSHLFDQPNFDVSLFNPFLPESSTLPVTNPAPAAPPATAKPPANSPAFNPTNLVNQISQAALAALSIVKAYRSLDQPAINSTARIVRPDGTVSVITSNGMVQSRSPAGAVTSAKPPVGVPQSTADGNVIVNNGDGTYTVISPAGQTATYNYASGSASSGGILSGISTPMLIAGGAAVLLLLKRRGK